MLIKVDWNSKKSLKEAVAPKLNDNFWKWFGNSKTIKNGKPIIYYHRTNAEFDTFSKDYNDGLLVSGFYFSEKPLSDWYGKNIKECYLKMENPYIIENMDNIDDIEKFVKTFGLFKKKRQLKDIKSALKEYSEARCMDRTKEFDGKSALRSLVKWDFNDQTSKITNIVKNRGYDSLIFKNSNGKDGIVFDEYIVFEPNQIKSVNNNGDWSLTSDNINETLIESTEPNESNLNKNFWNWFKGSKTVDEQGNPLIFYHGTKQPNITNFKAKYDDSLVFFAYNEEFAKEWASNAPLTPDQEQGVRDFQGSDDLANYRKEVMDRYKRDYGDNWADDDDIRDAARWEIKEYEKQKYKQMGIEENVMPVYIKAIKIFNPARDYSKVIKEISDHWDLDLKADYKQELEDARSEYQNVEKVINKWFKEHNEYKNDPVMEPEFRKREDILINALNEYNSVRDKINQRNYHLKRIMSGAWIYFENPETINKIWELGYDAIELSEHSGVITTLAVREGTNQVKSIFNFGNWGSDTNIFETN